MTHSRFIPERNLLNLSWLIKLRWASVVGQLVTLVTVKIFIGVDIPVPELSFLIGLAAVSNVYCQFFLSKKNTIEEWHLAMVMTLDTLLLTGLLYFTGGPFNPFWFLYLVNIALAAVALRATWTWMLVGFALLCIGLFLFIGYRPLPIAHFPFETQALILQRGVWVAFGVASTFIVHFLLRVTKVLATRDEELSLAQEVARKQDRLASLATMAAGAAHELATPLGTIAVIANEIERTLEPKTALADDVNIIRNQVARCRVILDQMAGGTRSGDQAIEKITVCELISEAMTGVRERPRVMVSADNPQQELLIPPRGVAQALRGFITNAQDATSDSTPVNIEINSAQGEVTVEIIDSGRGMEKDVLARVGEPFFSTKAPGSGMGLGVFLGRAVFERLGGAVKITSETGEGTRVRVTLPHKIDPQAIQIVNYEQTNFMDKSKKTSENHQPLI